MDLERPENLLCRVDGMQAHNNLRLGLVLDHALRHHGQHDVLRPEVRHNNLLPLLVGRPAYRNAARMALLENAVLHVLRHRVGGRHVHAGGDTLVVVSDAALCHVLDVVFSGLVADERDLRNVIPCETRHVGNLDRVHLPTADALHKRAHAHAEGQVADSDGTKDIILAFVGIVDDSAWEPVGCDVQEFRGILSPLDRSVPANRL